MFEVYDTIGILGMWDHNIGIRSVAENTAAGRRALGLSYIRAR